MITSARTATVLGFEFFLAVFVLIAAPASTGEISGIVKDAQGLAGRGELSPNTLTSAQKFERVTDEQGRFLLPALRVGECVMTVDMPGFSRAVRKRLVQQLGQRLELNFVLEIGGMTGAPGRAQHLTSVGKQSADMDRRGVVPVQGLEPD